MQEKLFTESFFKKNSYFRKQLEISNEKMDNIKKLIQNWQNHLLTFSKEIDKETSVEGEFIHVIFDDILGYTGKGKNSNNYSYLQQFTISGSGATGSTGFADLALGYFTKSEHQAQVLIEFKDSSSDDLEKVSTRKDKLSPVNQCWNYLNCYPDAKWGIVTNFNEIRLYHKATGKQKCEIFYFNVPIELKEKYLPLSEETELLKFIAILKKENLIALSGVSFTEDILKTQGIEEQKVQKGFYLDYKKLRIEMFYKLLELNPLFEDNKSKLLSLVQKLLDRVIFCWFCEDSREQLLPTNILYEIINEETKSKYYSKNEFNIYGKVQTLFRAIDSGGHFNIINGYNGELFKTDEELDTLKIPNNIFERISEISKEYDFGDENELNVNILGHIFEQSISDLEEMRISFKEYSQTQKKTDNKQLDFLDSEENQENKEDYTFNKNKSKRKKEGVYYTPEYITRYIVENTVGAWLGEKYKLVEEKYKNLKRSKEFKILDEYRKEYLSKIKILDPACGSGAFLIAAFNYLWKEHQRVYNEIKLLKTKEAQNNLELFDFDSIDKTILESNLYGVDLNKESVEITKLSLWLKTASKNKKLNSLEKHIQQGNSLIDDPAIAGDSAFKWNERFTETMDNGGFDVVIGNPPYVDNRGFDKDNLKYLYANFPNSFKKSGTDKYKTTKLNLIAPFFELSTRIVKLRGFVGFILHKNILKTTAYESIRKHLLDNFDITNITDWGAGQFANVTAETVTMCLCKSSIYNDVIKINYYSLNSFIKTEYQSQKTFIDSDNHIYNIYSDEKDKLVLQKIEAQKSILNDLIIVNNGIVTGNDEKFISNKKLNEAYKPTARGKDIKKYNYLFSKEFVLYDKQNLLRARDENIFLEKEKLIMQMINTDFILTYDDKNFYNLGTTYAITNISKFNLKSILCVLNSKLLTYYYQKKYTNNSTLTNAISTQNMLQIPIFDLSDNEKIFIKKADTMLSKNKEFYESKQKFLNLLTADTGLQNITKKLEDWFLLDWKEFQSELVKHKIELSGKLKDDWYDRFNRLKKESLDIKNIIDTTDKEIDQMVYKLYDLTDEEISIVEESVRR